MRSVTPEESFLIQSYAFAECISNLAALEKNKDPLITDNSNRIYGNIGKESIGLGSPVFQGQGTLISVLYMILVLPLEWKNNKVGDFEKFDFSGAEKIANTQFIETFDTYGERNIALKHLRNALAHGRLGFTDDQKLIVEDRWDDKGFKYKGEYSMESLGEIAQSLSLAIADYIDTVIGTRPS